MKIGNIAFYEAIRRILSFGIFEKPIVAELAATNDETVLDLGCGTGAYSRIVPGRYFGIDIDGDLVKYARNKYSQPNRTFFNGTLRDLIQNHNIRSVDKAFIVNVLHHLSDQEVHANLYLLAKITKKSVVIIDMDKGGSSWWQKFFFLFDDGKFIRNQEELKHLILKHFQIKKSFIYFPPTCSIRLCLFHCVPKRPV